MPELLLNLWVWVQANPWTTVAIVVYLIVNLAPRPHPEQHEGWAKTFWLVIDRLSVMTAGSVPGKLKMLFADSPVPKLAPAKVASAVAKAKRTTKKKGKPQAEEVKPAEPKDEKKADAPDDEPEVELDGPGADETQGKDEPGT